MNTLKAIYLALQDTSMLHTEDLWCIPGITPHTLQPVQVVLVEDLGRDHFYLALCINLLFTSFYAEMLVIQIFVVLWLYDGYSRH